MIMMAQRGSEKLFFVKNIFWDTHVMLPIPIHPPAVMGFQSDSIRIPITVPPIQRKLTVSSLGDPFEREADDVADEVMRMAEPASIDSSPSAIQCEYAECEDEVRTPNQTKRAPSANTEAALDAGAVVRVTERGGAPLPSWVRSYFEPRFGHDFSCVRVHADDEAANAARAVRARAYTIGREIVFGAGEYAPATMEGKRLLAHELAYVVQQRHLLHAGIVMRQPAAAPQAHVRTATVKEAAEFLEDMTRFLGVSSPFRRERSRAGIRTERGCALRSWASSPRSGRLRRSRSVSRVECPRRLTTTSAVSTPSSSSS